PGQARTHAIPRSANSRPTPSKGKARAPSLERSCRSLAYAMHEISKRAAEQTPPHQIELDTEKCQQRPDQQSQYQPKPVDHYACVSRRGHEERHRRQEQKSAGKKWRQSGRQIEPDKSEDGRGTHIAGRHAVTERNAPLMLDTGQEPQ